MNKEVFSDNFILESRSYNYFYHDYNNTRFNERAVEIPIIWEIVKEYQNLGKNILERKNNKELSKHIAYKHKQIMQLASKTRFIAVQFEAMLQNELWRKTSTHANKMAELLCKSISKNRHVKITKPVQANAVFAEIPRNWYAPLQEHYPFYVWKDSTHEVRLMCAWDTKEEEILAFAEAINALPE